MDSNSGIFGGESNDQLPARGQLGISRRLSRLDLLLLK